MAGIDFGSIFDNVFGKLFNNPQIGGLFQKLFDFIGVKPDEGQGMLKDLFLGAVEQGDKTDAATTDPNDPTAIATAAATAALAAAQVPVAGAPSPETSQTSFEGAASGTTPPQPPTFGAPSGETPQIVPAPKNPGE